MFDGENTDYEAAQLTLEEQKKFQENMKPEERSVGYSENGDYEAAPAFDSPEEQLKHDQEEAEKAAKEEERSRGVHEW